MCAMSSPCTCSHRFKDTLHPSLHQISFVHDQSYVESFMCSVYQFGLKYTCLLAVSRALFPSTMVIKRPAVSGCEGRAAKRPSVCAGDIDDAMTKNTSGNCRLDRKKKYYFDTHRRFLPESVNMMLVWLPCHQRGKLISNLVQADPAGGWRFNVSNHFVQDFLCAC